MIVYQTDYEGFLVGQTSADPDPLVEGNWLIPGGCIETAPPALGEGQRAKWSEGKWSVVDPEPEPTPAPEPELTPEELLTQTRERRQYAFQSEADPLFFKWQAGEGTEVEWLAKREEIRNRFPYPETGE
jgi:hypothetical protein